MKTELGKSTNSPNLPQQFPNSTVNAANSTEMSRRVLGKRRVKSFYSRGGGSRRSLRKGIPPSFISVVLRQDRRRDLFGAASVMRVHFSRKSASSWTLPNVNHPGPGRLVNRMCQNLLEKFRIDVGPPEISGKLREISRFNCLNFFLNRRKMNRLSRTDHQTKTKTTVDFSLLPWL